MKIIVVDDDRNMCKSLKRVLELEGFEVTVAENGLSAQRILEEEVFSLAVIDLKMPGLDGMELLAWIKESGLRLPVVMVSAYGDIDDAVKALKVGASDYIVKPFSSEELVLRVKRVIDEQKLKNLVKDANLNRDMPQGESLVGESKAIVNIGRLIEKISATSSSVLITGESGTGKEVVARMIHRKSLVKDGPFIPVNIGGIHENLVESELFGYEKGAFTGATGRKIGRFELASSGTLFLDEIGDMPVHLQVKLLRVLQEKRIMRLGGTREIPIDIRLISATNKNLEKLVKEGLFREDLYYRLNVVHIDIPPLKDRKEDIPLLAAYILGKKATNLGKRVTGFTEGAVEMLENYSYPGNVRELENIIERACIFAEGEVITESELSISGDLSKVDSSYKPRSLKSMEREAIIKALRRWDGNKSRAAKELGIARRTIINKIKEYGIKD